MEEFLFDLSILLVVSALLSSLAILLKQPIIVAYILSGVVIGPWGFKLIQKVEFIEGISHLGITLLLFLAGLNLHPQRLLKLFRSAAIVTVVNSVASFIMGFLITYFFKFPLIDCLVVGLAMMFSSTILVVKLLPTTDLHQKRMGGVCIGVLILQDLLAVAVLAFVRCLESTDGALVNFTFLSLRLILFIGILALFEFYVLKYLMAKVDRFHEALFVLGLAWCFGVATLSHEIGLFYETGAFFSGVVLARHKIAYFISEELKPIRDFFLVLFFFTMGARLDLSMIKDLAVVAILISSCFLFIRPKIFKMSLMFTGEKEGFSKEAGVRLGQLSEFALLIGILAFEINRIQTQTAQLIQLSTLITFVVSSYIVFRSYPTPIGASKELKKN